MPPDMSRADHYSEGYSLGTQWAEQDMSKNPALVWEMRELTREEATLAHSIRALSPAHDSHAAYLLGRARGYRLLSSDN